MKFILMLLSATLILICGSGCDWDGIYNMLPWRASELRRLDSIPVWQWTAYDQKEYPKHYLARRMFDLPNMPTVHWTNEEKNRERKLFLTLFQKEVGRAVKSLQNDIQHWEKELVRCTRAADEEREKIVKSEDFMRQAVPLLKQNRFPVTLYGVTLTKAELEKHLISYQTLRKNARIHFQEYNDLKQAASEQLELKRRMLVEKHAEYESCGSFIARLNAKERIGSIRQVMAEIRKSMDSAKTISADVTPVLEQEHRSLQGQKSEDRETLDALQKEFQ